MNRINVISFITKRVGAWIFILLLMIMVVIFLQAVCLSQGSKPAQKKSEAAIQVKIPDGLYLYKPDFTKETISPLVLIKNGKMLDPYALAIEKGFSSFLNQYVTGKTFYAYVGPELYGNISNLNLSSISMKFRCQTDEFVPNIRGVGLFEGKSLPHGWLTEKTIEEIRYRIFGSTKVIFAPQLLQVSKKPIVFSATESDMRRMVEAVQKNLVPSAIEHINKRLEKRNRKVIGEKASRLYVAEAFDLNGNGKKDMVGVYYLSAKHDNPIGFWPHDILFILWDSGKIERIDSRDKTPAYMIGGIVDIDLDGIQELILTTSISSEHEDGGDGRQIDILRYGISGWKSIYRTKWICGFSSSDAYYK